MRTRRTLSGAQQGVWRSVAVASLALVMLAAAPVRAQPAVLDTAVGPIEVSVFADGLNYPWSAIRLPDGDLLVSEKHPGRLRRVGPDGDVSAPLARVPAVDARGNGGLLGLALDRDFERNRRLYLAFSEPGEGEAAGLSVASARLGPERIDDVEIVFRQTPKVADERNFGGRLVVGPDGMIYVMTGDRFAFDQLQRPDNTLGVVARIAPDGTAPPDNPFVGDTGFVATIWSRGHRNIGGAAFHPETGRLWLHEFGPYGGDELNVVEPGANYGWPLVSWGRHYRGEPIPVPPTRPHLAAAIFHWNPVVSPSGMVFYDGDAFRAWSGDLLLGGLSSQSLIRLTLRGERVIAEERMAMETRIRDVLLDDVGAVLLLTDEPAPHGRILRLTPAPQ